MSQGRPRGIRQSRPGPEVAGPFSKRPGRTSRPGSYPCVEPPLDANIAGHVADERVFDGGHVPRADDGHVQRTVERTQRRCFRLGTAKQPALELRRRAGHETQPSA